MNIALVYDRINTFGGAERVLQAMHEIWPNAPLYTSVYHPIKASFAKEWDIRSSFINHLPWLRDKHQWLAPIMPYAFESFNFSSFDVVISVTSAEAKGIITSPNTLHICYCLTPTRYLWSHSHEYASYGLGASVNHIFQSALRRWDYVAAYRPDYLIPISKEVQRRIHKYYRREPLPVIYPPVDIQFFSKHPKKCYTNLRNYYLIVGRPVNYKNTNLAIEAFKHIPNEQLVIIGQEKPNIPNPNNIFFMGKVTDHELACYYHHSQALLFPQEEDFGIVAVEAQAAGKPVIAYGKGGVVDTVIPDKTGVFFHEQTPASLASAIDAQKRKPWYDTDISAHARRFSVTRFKTQMNDIVEALWLKTRR